MLRQFVTEFTSGPIILCGDLNVAYEDSDLTHPSFFKVTARVLFCDGCVDGGGVLRVCVCCTVLKRQPPRAPHSPCCLGFRKKHEFGRSAFRVFLSFLVR